MLLLLVSYEISFPKIAPSPIPRAVWLSTWEWAFLVRYTHVFGVLRLRAKWPA